MLKDPGSTDRWTLRSAAVPILTFALGIVVGGMGVGRLFQAGQAPPAEQIVTGIGGVFFKANDPQQLSAWYRQHLGMTGDGPGISFFWREHADPALLGYTVWSVFPRDTAYFGPGEQDSMINYRVRHLDALLAKLELEGVQQVGEVEEYWYGRFAWIVDGEGNRVELWEPVPFEPEEFEQRFRSETSR